MSGPAGPYVELVETAKQFFKVVEPFFTPTSRVRKLGMGFDVPHSRNSAGLSTNINPQF